MGRALWREGFSYLGGPRRSKDNCQRPRLLSSDPSPAIVWPMVSVVNLSLTRARCPSVRGGGGTCGVSVSKRMRTLGESAARFTNRRHLLVLHLDQRTCSPAAALGHRLLVGRKVERDEEEQVRREDADSGDGSELFAVAFSSIGEPRPVGAGEVGPGGKVDEACVPVSGVGSVLRARHTEIEDELHNLHDGDVLLPPDLDATSALEIVPVHDNVDGEIEGDNHPRDGRTADELRVAEKSRSAMVVSVEESYCC